MPSRAACHGPGGAVSPSSAAIAARKAELEADELDARLLAERLPQARLHWAEGAGHDPTQPAMVAAMAAALAELLALAEQR